MESSYTFELTQQDKQSHLWLKLKKHFEYILQRERIKNDHQQSDVGTAVRGKIALAKELIALGEKKEKEEEEGEEE